MPQHDITEPLHSLVAHVVMNLLVAGLALPLLLQLRRIPARLLVLMASAFVDMVGLLMLVPLTPFYVQKFAPNGLEVGGVHIGLGTVNAAVLISFQLAQSLASPIWGRFSDRHGRRPTLLVALCGAAAGYLVFGFADSLWLLVLSRVVQGAGGGTVGVIQSYVADSTAPADRALALGWLSAATNLGVALGPQVGQYAQGLRDVDLCPGAGTLTLGDAAPGVIAALICLANMVFVAVWLRESNTERAGATQGAGPQAAAAPDAASTLPVRPARPPRPRGASLSVLRHPNRPTSRLIWTYALAMGAYMGANSQLALFLGARHGVVKESVGVFWTWTGAISVFVRTLLLGPMLTRFGEARLSRIGLATLACGLGLLPFAGSLWTLALAVGLIPFGTAFTFPCVTGLLSKVIAPTERGLWMGLQQTYGGLLRILGPLGFGFAFDHISISSPFWFASAIVLATISIGFGFDRLARPPAPDG
jgi:MFS family permease